MKKLIASFVIISISAVGAFAASSIYSAKVSTFSVTDAGVLSQINKSKVNVKQIVIMNPTSTAQTVSIYKNFTSTTAATKLMDIAIPASVGPFYPIGGNVIQDTAAGDVDSIPMPYFAARTDGTVVSSAAYITVIYK